mmetsp:Transcript_18423/g.55552  ORF Transcript_18423/g.55552 Transcript_18423/m.55552 type:complete len:275 (-) Transcript_18423:2297-3121(-)
MQAPQRPRLQQRRQQQLHQVPEAWQWQSSQQGRKRQRWFWRAMQWRSCQHSPAHQPAWQWQVQQWQRTERSHRRPCRPAWRWRAQPWRTTRRSHWARLRRPCRVQRWQSWGRRPGSWGEPWIQAPAAPLQSCQHIRHHRGAPSTLVPALRLRSCQRSLVPSRCGLQVWQWQSSQRSRLQPQWAPWNRVPAWPWQSYQRSRRLHWQRWVPCSGVQAWRSRSCQRSRDLRTCGRRAWQWRRSRRQWGHRGWCPPGCRPQAWPLQSWRRRLGQHRPA